MPSQPQTNTWQQQLKQALGRQHPLVKQVAADPDYAPDAAQLFSHVVTEQMLQVADLTAGLNDPIVAQFLPQTAETIETPGYINDPVGDHQATQIPGLIHKYHGRVLLIASGSCAVNCRYCFRRHFPYSQSFAPRNHWQAAIKYISQQPDIHEVILSGGDPLTLETQSIRILSDALQNIPHIKTLRIHSRIPVVLPQRIDPEFIQWAQQLKLNKVMVIHVNHAQELSDSAQIAIADLRAAGFIMLNQSVLLKNINDKLDVLSQLSHQLFALGVLPYYLHQMDAVQNAAHFTVAESKAIELHRQLRSSLPGYLVPKLVKEEAGKDSKTNLIK